MDLDIARTQNSNNHKFTNTHIHTQTNPAASLSTQMLLGMAPSPGAGGDLSAEQSTQEETADCRLAPSLQYNIEHFPQKVDRLLNCISKVSRRHWHSSWWYQLPRPMLISC